MNRNKKPLSVLIVGLILALATWAGATIVSQGQRLSKVETESTLIQAWLTRVENKLDFVLSRED